MLEPILRESHLLTLEAKVDKIENDILQHEDFEDYCYKILDHRKCLKLTLSQAAIHRGCVNDKGEPQIAGLFVPVGLDGELLEKPESFCSSDTVGNKSVCEDMVTGDCICEIREAYQQAKERMLFKMDLKVVKVKPNQCILEGNEDRKNFLMSPETTISELAQATKDEPLEILKR